MTEPGPSIEVSAIPSALRDHDQWVCWREEQRDGKPTKVPVTPGTGSFASATDPDTWAGFETACEFVEAGAAAGIGFVFTDDDPVVGIDLDDCRDPENGEGNDTAADIIERLDSYTEVSPSGTGYHVLVEGELPDGRNRRGNVECYDSARFFTVTGEHVAETPTHVARRQDALVAIHREYVQDTDAETPAESASDDGVDDIVEPDSSIEVDLEDEALLEKARNASNGKKFERLWSGDTAGYDSHSEADMALCCLLAFWTGGDRARMDHLFRQSGLLREKWDDIHYADGSTYGEKTIERALAATSEFYDPDSSDQVSESDGSSDAGHATPGGDTGQNSAYLEEKNRLLTERVTELEATLEQKTDRIAELEADLRELEDALSDRDDRIQRLQAQRETADDTSENAPAQQSLWRLSKRFISKTLK